MFEPVTNHDLAQTLNEAFRGVNSALRGMYTKSYQRLALRQFVLAYVVREMKEKSVPLPLQSAEKETQYATAEGLADGFLGEHAKGWGWGKVGEGFGRGGPEEPSETEKGLRRHLVAYVVQLLQMPADAEEEVELCELVLSETGGDAGGDVDEDADEGAGGNAIDGAASSSRSANADGRKVSEVQSEPEDFQKERPSQAPRRSRSLVGRLGAFVDMEERARRRLRNQKRHQRKRVKKRLEREAQTQAG